MRATFLAALLLPLLLPGCPATAQDNLQAEPGLEAGVRYVADALANVDGGLREGSAWVDYLELAAGLDVGRYLGAGNLGVFASVVNTNAATFSDRYVGDAMIVSNIDSAHALRVLEAWVDWGFDPRRFGSVRAGLYDLNSEFDTGEARGLFLNSAYGMGQELAQSGRNGPSVYPVTALAARVAWSPRDPWLLKFAVVDGVPGRPSGTHRSRWHLSTSEGALCIGEVTTSAGPLTQLSLGHWRYTAAFERLRPGRRGGDAAFAHDNRGTYLTAEFAPEGPAPEHGPRWRAFIRAGEANDRINVFERHVAAGVVVGWPWPQPRGSELGLAVSEARVGAGHRAARLAAADPAGRYERNVELTWRVPLGDHVVLQPDLQYVVNPGAERRIPDAWVAGLRVELVLQRQRGAVRP